MLRPAGLHTVLQFSNLMYGSMARGLLGRSTCKHSATKWKQLMTVTRSMRKPNKKRKGVKSAKRIETCGFYFFRKRLRAGAALPQKTVFAAR